MRPKPGGQARGNGGDATARKRGANSVNTKTLVRICIGLVLCVILVACGGGGASSGTSTTASSSSATLTQISVSGIPASLTVAQSVHVTATGTYSDGSTKDLSSSATWASSDNAVATVSASGQVTAVGPGTATISASSAGKNASAATHVVAGSPSALAELVVTPGTASLAAGLEQQFAAFGIFNDGTSVDLTEQVTWTSSDETIAKMTDCKVVGVKSGNVTITATSGTVVGTAALTVTSARLQAVDITPDLPSVDINGEMQFNATGTFSDGSTGILGPVWSSGTPAVATIDAASGLAKGVSAGTSNVGAAVGNTSDSTVLTVNPATLVSIGVAPASATMPIGVTQQFVATATFSDGSTQPLSTATWSSDATSVVSIDSASGLATALANGTAHVSASTAGLSASATITVNAATLQSIAVTPSSLSIGIGGTVQFAAAGTFSNGAVVDMTPLVAWSSSDGNVMMVSLAGVGIARAQGNATISATYNGVTGAAALTVTSAVLRTIDVQPNSPVMVPRSRLQLSAVGNFTDGTSHPLVGVRWSSTVPRVASVWSSGVVRSKRSGTATIRASVGSVTGSESLLVTSSPVQSITITPAIGSAAVNGTQQFVATGTLGDRTTVDLTLAVRWITSDYRIATINSAGLATGAKAGSVTITATYGAISTTATLNIN